MLSYRFANLDDADLYYEWANDAEVRKNSFNCEKIKYEDHLDWFTDKLANKKNLFILFLLSDLPAGQVRIELLENVGKINFSLSKEFRGQGLSWKILKMACDIFFDSTALNVIVGEVKFDNAPSQKAFLKAGFQESKNKQCFVYTKIKKDNKN